MGRVAIFVDGAYVDFMMREEFKGARVAFERFFPALIPPRAELLRAYYYACGPHVSDPSTADERERQRRFDRFRTQLEQIPRCEIRLGKLSRREDPKSGAVRYEQKRVDIQLGIDVVRLAIRQQISELVLVAGDSDFVPAIQAAKDEGVLCRLYHGRSPHRELRQAFDECCQIDQKLVDKVKR